MKKSRSTENQILGLLRQAKAGLPTEEGLAESVGECATELLW